MPCFPRTILLCECLLAQKLLHDKLLQRLIVLVAQTYHFRPTADRSPEFGLGLQHDDGHHDQSGHDEHKGRHKGVQNGEAFGLVFGTIRGILLVDELGVRMGAGSGMMMIGVGGVVVVIVIAGLGGVLVVVIIVGHQWHVVGGVGGIGSTVCVGGAMMVGLVVVAMFGEATLRGGMLEGVAEVVIGQGTWILK